jgi:hypothetical protein
LQALLHRDQFIVGRTRHGVAPHRHTPRMRSGAVSARSGVSDKSLAWPGFHRLEFA